MMKTIVTMPDGKEVTFEGDTVRFSSHPEVCHKISPKMRELLVHHAWHKGYRVKSMISDKVGQPSGEPQRGLRISRCPTCGAHRPQYGSLRGAGD